MTDRQAETAATGEGPSAPADAAREVFLRPGGDRRLAAGVPWVFSNEVRMDLGAKAIEPGTLVTLRRADGKPLGVGSFNANALIAFRLFDRDGRATIDADWLDGRLARALEIRERLYDEPFYRLVHAEADGLPGFIVDRYGPVAVVQANTAGADRLMPEMLAALDRVMAPDAVVARNDSTARAQEGLPTVVTTCTGRIDGPVEVREGGATFLADVLAGQKTGWFFDQRDNRRDVAPLGRNGAVLDAYCYTGGFAIGAALAGAATVDGIDGSEAAIELAAAAARLNGVDKVTSFRRADVFDELGRLADDRRRYRLVIADPPAFVRSRKDLASGLKGYRKLARLAAPVVERGGFLSIASCSHNVDMTAFVNEVAIGLDRAGRSGRILRQSGAAADHPVHPRLPETAYLKALLIALD
jgi:23S rRNA (cytosine1962-C5)-methyltransferase